VPDFCESCGAPLLRDSPDCERCGYGPSSEAWKTQKRKEYQTYSLSHCSLCGSKMYKKYRVCLQCGHDAVLGMKHSILYSDQDFWDEFLKSEENDVLYKRILLTNELGLKHKWYKQFGDAQQHFKEALAILKEDHAENTRLAQIIQNNLSSLSSLIE